VHHEREREAGEPVAGGDDGRAAGELDQPQRPAVSGIVPSATSAAGTPRAYQDVAV